MSLMSLVRWIGAAVIGWTLVAIGMGASGARLRVREAAERPSARPHYLAAMPRNWPMTKGFDLVDRTNGHTAPIRLPGGEEWSNVAISPAYGAGGALEAIGRWVNRERDDFSGWGVFRLSDGAVLSRVASEVLPTGRPCWIPGQSAMILFAAGDGRLHRCRLSAEDVEPVVRRPAIYASGLDEPSDPVVWEVAPPGLGQPMMTDPVWPDAARLKQWVFVAMTTLEERGKQLVYGASQIWWLEMSDDASTIVSAGRLTSLAAGGSDPSGIEQRFPNVAIGPEGDSRLVYLERENKDMPWRLRSGTLQFDARTGRPVAVTDVHSPIPEPQDRFLPTPLLTSADGATVYGLSEMGGLVARPLLPRRNREGLCAGFRTPIPSGAGVRNIAARGL